MPEHVPSITLTDPHNQAGPYASAQSPVKSSDVADVAGGRFGNAPKRPGSSGSARNAAGPPTESSAWPSAGRLIRSRSRQNGKSNVATNNSDSTTREEQINGSGRQEGQAQAQASMDPLSEHIMKRTNESPQPPVTNSGRLTPSSESLSHKEGRTSSERSDGAAVQDVRSALQGDSAEHAHKDLKKGVKAVSFLSRLIGTTKKKPEADKDVGETESVLDDGRPEGNDAKVFTDPADSIGYNPRHPQPPAYIKVRSRYKKERDLDHLFLAQELDCTRRPKLARQDSGNKLRRKSSATPDGDTVWAMEFSKDGKHLAAAGADMTVRVWTVLSSPEDRQQHEKQETTEGAQAEHLSAPVFQQRPIREYHGHTATVLDLSWSKNNFLLSSSMDKTVRLWHISRVECLCTFKHNDFVPSIAFHPRDDRFFLAGSLDSKLRLWSIPDKSVAYAAQVPDMITAVAFAPDGRCAMAGCLTGLCMFFGTEGLKYQTQMNVRSTRGQNAKGSKITGLQTQYSEASGDTKILVTSNDSRIRLYNLRDKSLDLKLRGNENNCSQIRASFSDDGRYVVCGSEDRLAYLWSLDLDHAEGEKRDRRPVEMFEAHNAITTVVAVAPATTRALLGKSGDPIYNLCNPSPTTLMSRVERAESRASSRPATENGSAHTPADVDARFDKAVPSPSLSKDTTASPAYIARSAHKDGNIIVTADFTGRIKVFRQDCAWSRRQQQQLQQESDRGSLFGRRSQRSTRNGSTTLATRGSQRSLGEREPRTSTSTQAPSERILDWRRGVGSTPSLAGTSSAGGGTTRRSSDKVEEAGLSGSPGRTSSAEKDGRPSSGQRIPSADDAIGRNLQREGATGHSHDVSSSTLRDTGTRNGTSSAPTHSGSIATAAAASSSTHQPPSTPPNPAAAAVAAVGKIDASSNPASPSSPSQQQPQHPRAGSSGSPSSPENPLSLIDGRSYTFWDTEIWRARSAKMHEQRRQSAAQQGAANGSEEEALLGVQQQQQQRPGLLKPSPGGSFVSVLSDERGSSVSGDRESGDEGEGRGFVDARET